MRRRLSILAWPRPKGGPRQTVCHFCDTLHDASPVSEGTAARCVRCGATLYQNRPASLVRATAFSLSALILMGVVHSFPFLTMDAGTDRTTLNPVAAATALIDQGSLLVGLSVALFTIIAPLVLAGGLIYVCAPLLGGRAAPGAMTVARWMHRTEPWNMIEVFLLGVLVSMIKLSKTAELEFGPGFWAFAGLMFCMAAAIAGIDRNELWDRLEVARS
jgi:paraquat-inducible protein A